MEISITGHHIEVTPDLSSYVRTQLARVEKRLDGAIRVAILIAGKAKNGVAPSIQIVVDFAGKKQLVIKKYLPRTIKSFYTIITKAFDALGITLNRHAGVTDKKHHRERTSTLRLKNKSFAPA